ncbi:MAG: hypothetical protein GXX78_15050 [Bacteroidales bacterium]|nr:hypothetical protein [Bacteroidales bacterium]
MALSYSEGHKKTGSKIMIGKRTNIFIAVFIAVMFVAVIFFYYQKIGDKKRSLICAKSYTNLILKMYEAQTLLDAYVENAKVRTENKHLIKRNLEEARMSYKEMMSHSGKTKLRIHNLKQAIDDWERFSSAVVSAFGEISEKGIAEDTGEIPAYSKLAMENFIQSMFIAFSTFSNLEPEPPVKEKENIKLNLSQEDRQYLSGRLQNAYKSICSKEKEKKILSGIEWSLIGTKNFIDDPNIGIEQIISCKEIH